MASQITNDETQIDSAWTGKHVVIILCRLATNQFLSMTASIGAPVEPTHSNGAETLSRFLSIGYRIVLATPIPPYDIQYLLVKP